MVPLRELARDLSSPINFTRQPWNIAPNSSASAKSPPGSAHPLGRNAVLES